MANKNQVEEVDTRVVEMQFDNKQFEKGATQTLSTLDKLKKSLDFRNASKGFDSLQKGINAITFNPITSQLDTINGAFNTLAGSIKRNFFDQLSNEILDLGKQLYNVTAGRIISGGKSRAMNIAQAKFKMEGMGVTWDQIKEDLDYAVSGTAYGLDAAANIASQLTASGVQVGDAMKTALRGVSGVAAMTSSSYEEIGNVFAAVAGQGKAMAMQLNQLSLRGINAASTIADYLGVTEAEVREMASKGQISFEIFSNAMDSAFGEHAKEANKTFTGAFSNIQAALSKVGELFFDPFYNSAIAPLNTIRETISMIKDGLVGGLSDMDTVYGTRSTAERLNQIIMVTGDIINTILTAVKKGLKQALKFLKPVNKMMVSWLHNLKEFRSWLKSLGGDQILDTVTDVVTGIQDITDAQKEMAWEIWNNGKFGDGIERIKNLGENYKNVQTYLEALIANNFDVANAEEALGIAGEKTGKTQEKLNTTVSKLSETLSKILSVIKNVMSVSKAIVKHAIGTLSNVFSRIKEDIYSVFNPVATLSDFMGASIRNAEDGLSKLSDTKRKDTALKAFLESTYKIIDALGEVIWYAYTGIKGFITIAQDAGSVLFSSGITNTLASIMEFFAARVVDKNTILDAIRAAISLIDILAVDIAKVVKAIAVAYASVAKPAAGKVISSVTDLLNKLSKYLVLTDKDYQNLIDTFRGAFSILRFTRHLFFELVNTLSTIFPELKTGDSVLLSITGAIGRFVVTIEETLEQGSFFADSAKIIVKALVSLKEGFEYVTGINIKKWFDEAVYGFALLAKLISENGLVDGIKKFKETENILNDIWSSISKLITDIISTVTKFFTSKKKEKKPGLLDPLTDAIDNDLIPSVTGLIEKLKGLLDTYGNAIDSITSSITDDKTASVQNATSNLSSITGAIASVSTKAAGDSEITVDNFVRISKAFSAVSSSLGFLLTGAGISKIGTALKIFSKSFKQVVKTLQSISVTVKTYLNIQKTKATAELIKSLAIGIIAIAASIIGVAAAIKFLELGNKELGWACGIIAGTLVLLGAFIIVVSKLASPMIVLGVAGTAAAIAILTATILSVATTIASMDESKFKKFRKSIGYSTGLVAAILGSILVLFLVLSGALKAINKHVTANKVTAIATEIGNLGAAVFKMSLSVAVLLGAIAIFAWLRNKFELSWEEVKNSFVAMAAVIVVLTGAMIAIMKAVKGANDKQIKATATLIKRFSNAVSTMLVAIAAIFALVIFMAGAAQIAGPAVYVMFAVSVKLIIGIIAGLAAIIFGILDGVGKLPQTKETMANLETIVHLITMLSLFMAVVALSFAVINSSLLKGSLISNIVTIAVIPVLMGALLKFVIEITDKLKLMPKSASGGTAFAAQLEAFGKMFEGIAKGLSLMFASISLLVTMATIANNFADNFTLGLTAGIVGAVLLFSYSIVKLLTNTKITTVAADNAEKILDSLTKFLAVFALTLLMVANSMVAIESYQISDRTVEIIGMAAGAITVILVLMYYVMTETSKTISNKKFLGTAGIMVSAMVATMLTIVGTLYLLTKIDWNVIFNVLEVMQNNIDAVNALISATEFITTIMAIIGVIFGVGGKGFSTSAASAAGAMLSLAGGILAVAGAISAVAAAVGLLAFAMRMLQNVFGVYYEHDLFDGITGDISLFDKSVKSATGSDLSDTVYDNGYSTGEAFSDGVTNGINDSNSDLNKAGKKAGASLAKGATNVLKIHSPSKVGEDIGGYFGQGIIKGLDSYNMKVYSKAELIGRSMSDGLLSGVDEISTDVSDSIYSSVESSFSMATKDVDVENPFKDFTFDYSYGDVYNDAPIQDVVSPVIDSDDLNKQIETLNTESSFNFADILPVGFTDSMSGNFGIDNLTNSLIGENGDGGLLSQLPTSDNLTRSIFGEGGIDGLLASLKSELDIPDAATLASNITETATTVVNGIGTFISTLGRGIKDGFNAVIGTIEDIEGPTIPNPINKESIMMKTFTRNGDDLNDWMITNGLTSANDYSDYNILVGRPDVTISKWYGDQDGSYDPWQKQK